VLSHSPLPDLAGRGTITGSFLAVGGPAGAPNEPQRGRILVRDNGRTTLTVRVAQDGRFSFQVLPGRYSLVGYSPQYNGGDAACQGARPSFAVRAGHRTLINVYCQRK
jgi:hypothetical protein